MCTTKNSTNLNHRTILNKYKKIVKNLQSRIFRAAQSGNHRQKKNLQKLLMRSQSNFVLALVKKHRKFNTTQHLGKSTKQLLLQQDKRLLLDMVRQSSFDQSLSLHKSLENIQSECKNHAIVFELDADKHSFKKYIVNFFSHFPYKKDLCRVLEQQSSQKMLNTFAYIFHNQLNNHTHSAIKFTCYQNKLLIMADKKSQLKIACKILYPLLEKSGLFIKSQQYSSLKNGIEFSGFTIRNCSEQVVIAPSEFEIRKHKNHLRKLWRWARGKEASVVIAKMNDVIKRWCHYFRYQHSNKTFKDLQAYQIKKQQKWATARHPQKSKAWIFAKYFGRGWRFAENSITMLKHTDFRIVSV